MQIVTFSNYSKCHDNYSIKKHQDSNKKKKLNVKPLFLACVACYYGCSDGAKFSPLYYVCSVSNYLYPVSSYLYSFLILFIYFFEL